MSTNRWPAEKTVARVIKHLEKDLGLSVYGRNVDLKDGQLLDAFRDYRAKDVLRLRKLVLKDVLWEAA
jgi:hypothetical protein